MAVKVTFDTANRLIIVNFGITTLDIRVDLYSDAKEDWESGALDISAVRLNKFIFPFRVIGGDDTAPGEIAPLYAYLVGGWRIRPHEADHVLNLVNGAILVDEDTTFDPFVDTVSAYNVRVRMYVPVQGTILESGTSGLTAPESQALLDIAADQVVIKADISTINTNIGTMTASLTSISSDISAMQGDLNDIEISITAIDADIVTINTNIGTIQTDISNLQVAQQFMADIEGGRWKIDTGANQMIFYKADNTSEVARFNLLDESGSPTSDPTRIAERLRV